MPYDGYAFAEHPRKTRTVGRPPRDRAKNKAQRRARKRAR